MHSLHDLSFLHEPVPQLIRDQQELLKQVLEPILYNRYQEKFKALQLDGNFLNECLVSPVYEKRTRKDIDESWNSAVKFTFPENHPVLKGTLEVAYSRASQKDFFGEIQIDNFFVEEVQWRSTDDYLAWWHKKMIEKLGSYYEKYGMVTCCNIGDFFNARGKTIVLQVPVLGVFKHYFRVDQECKLYVPSFGRFECQLYTANDYCILKEKQVFEYTVYRSIIDERKDADGAISQPDQNV